MNFSLFTDILCKQAIFIKSSGSKFLRAVSWEWLIHFSRESSGKMAKKAKKQDNTESRQKFKNEHVDIDEYKYIEFQYDAHGQGFESEVMLLT